jgi:sugar phosphate isomerase/epimerase
VAELGIEWLTVLGMPPVDFVNLAADLDCSTISCVIMGSGHHGLYRPFALRDEPALRREMAAAMVDRGISIALGESILVRPDGDVREFEGDLDVFHELGVRRVNTISREPDLGRTIDQVGVFVEMAIQRGMVTTVENCPGFVPHDLAQAVQIIKAVNRPEFRLNLDTMHVMRAGATVADIAVLDPRLIGYVQVSDSTMDPPGPDYVSEALTNRLVPGTGRLPLQEILGLVEPEVVVSVEVPMLAAAQAGVQPRERVGSAVTATRALLAERER